MSKLNVRALLELANSVKCKNFLGTETLYIFFKWHFATCFLTYSVVNHGIFEVCLCGRNVKGRLLLSLRQTLWPVSSKTKQNEPSKQWYQQQQQQQQYNSQHSPSVLKNLAYQMYVILLVQRAVFFLFWVFLPSETVHRRPDGFH